MSSASLSVARIPDAYCVRLQGRCTMAESPAFHEFVDHALRDTSQTVYVDVTTCQYLDSTFLGSLLDLHRNFARGPTKRFHVIAPESARNQLFAAMHLHRVFNFVDELPEQAGTWVELSCGSNLTKQDMARHVMECHRRLAEVEGPGQKAFAMIADQLERELGEKSAVSRQ